MMEMVKEKIETWKQKWKRMVRQNVNFHFQCFLWVTVGMYVLFFTSNLWMPEPGKLVNPTPLYQKVACGEYDLYLTQCVYSEQDQVLQIVLEKENKGVEDQKFLYEILERTGRKVEYQIAYEDPAYVVIRISEMMKNWKELSMHVDTKGGDVTAKFYMNVKEIQKVASLPELPEREYPMLRLQLQIGYDTARIDAKNKEIEQLKQENEKMQERIEDLQTDTYPTEAEAENAQGIIDRAENQIQSNEDTIRKREEEITGLETRSVNIEEQIQEMRQKEGAS